MGVVPGAAGRPPCSLHSCTLRTPVLYDPFHNNGIESAITTNYNNVTSFYCVPCRRFRVHVPPGRHAGEYEAQGRAGGRVWLDLPATGTW